MAFGDADRDTFLADFGVTVVYGVTTVKGIFGQRDEDDSAGFDARVSKNVTSLLVKTGALPGLAEDSLITIDGTQYRVRDPNKVRDGGFTRILVSPLV
jgi:hypothetical protein